MTVPTLADGFTHHQCYVRSRLALCVAIAPILTLRSELLLRLWFLSTVQTVSHCD